MADEFDKLVYVLFTLLHVCEHAPLKPVIKGSAEKKHVDLLNDIAFSINDQGKRRCYCSHDETEYHRYQIFLFEECTM